MNIYDTWLVKRYIAHRGLHNDKFPENSMGAFLNAANNNYPFEMDVQMTKDGVLMVFHDRNMIRMTRIDKNIDEVNYSDIKDVTLIGSSEKIPTMQQMLDEINGRVPILIEIKTHDNIGELEEKLTALLRNYSGEFAVQSFNPFIVKWFKDNAPEFIRGQLSCSFKGAKDINFIKRFLLRHMCFLKSNGSQFVSYDVSDIKRSQLKRIKKKMPVLMWTTRSKQQMNDAKGYFDNIIFEKFTPDKK